jgi:hypothetical protein
MILSISPVSDCSIPGIVFTIALPKPQVERKTIKYDRIFTKKAQNEESDEIDAYQAMAADTEREQEASEWCNSYFGLPWKTLLFLLKARLLRLNNRLYMWCRSKKRHYESLATRTTALLIIISCLLVISSCAEKEAPQTVVIEDTESSRDWFPEEYYPPYETIYLTSGKGYEFKNKNSNKLLVTMDGEPSWQAKVGKVGNKLDGVRFIDKILPLYTDYAFKI